MPRSFRPTLVSALSVCSLLLPLSAAAVRAADPKPLFDSKLVTAQTKGHAVDVDVDLNGAKSLYLVVTDGGNGFGADWADWAEPRLIMADKSEKKLTEAQRKTADQREVNKEKAREYYRVLAQIQDMIANERVWKKLISNLGGVGNATDAVRQKFKELNDTFGHPAGDAALIQVADAVRAAARPGETVVRLGGDELAVLVGDWTDGDPALGRFIEQHNRAGVPLYLWYGPGGGAPEVLPQLLTQDMLVRRTRA